MGLLDKLWDDVVAGPQPSGDHGFRSRSFPDQQASSPPPPAHEFGRRLLERRRSAEFQRQQEEARRVTHSIAIPKQPHVSIPLSPSMDAAEQEQLAASPSPSPSSSSPASAGARSSVERENVWRSVFHPGSNRAMKKLGSQKFDKPEPNSPTVYDWLYSGETKSSWR